MMQFCLQVYEAILEEYVMPILDFKLVGLHQYDEDIFQLLNSTA